MPVALDGEKMSAKDIILKLNQIGGANGIGILDIVENRLVGMKCRGVYETPGGTILYKAHSVLETLCLDKMTMHEKQKLAVTFAELVYNGQWFTPLREALSAFVDQDAGARHRHGAAQALQGQHDQRRRLEPVLPVLRGDRHLRRERLQPGGRRRASSTSTVCRSRCRQRLTARACKRYNIKNDFSPAPGSPARDN